MGYKEVFEECNRYSEKYGPVPVKISLALTMEDFVNTLYNECNGDNATEFVNYHYSRIMTILKDPIMCQEPLVNSYMLLNTKFLIALMHSLENKKVPYDELVAINRLYIKFIVNANTMNANPVVVNNLFAAYYGLAKIANAKLAISLLGVNITEEEAVNLASCRYTTNDEEVVRAMNNAIMNIISKEGRQRSAYMITRIYDLFANDSIEQQRDIFIYSMLNPITSEDVEATNSMNKALMDMLENLPMNSINSILKTYYNVLMYRSRQVSIMIPTRFNIYNYICLYQNYPRIASAVQYLFSVEGILV